MKKIIITTESCSDIPLEYMEKYNIKTVPLHIVFPTNSVPDGSIPVQKIYDYYGATKSIPKTSAVNPIEFTKFFDDLAEENEGVEIVHVGYSSACSCTFQNALLGVSDCKKAKVHLVDSKNVSGGAGLLTMVAIKILENNPSITPEELAKKIGEYVPRMTTWFVPDRLEYLVAGGRVSNAMALGASILKIKPRIDIIEGELIATKRYRGSMIRVVKKLTDDFFAENDLLKETAYIFYSEGADKEALEYLKDEFVNRGFNEALVFPIGCVMTTHGGPGAIGISAIKNV